MEIIAKRIFCIFNICKKQSLKSSYYRKKNRQELGFSRCESPVRPPWYHMLMYLNLNSFRFNRIISSIKKHGYDPR